MKQLVRLILFILLACSLSSVAGAEEPAAGKQPPMPTLLPAVPQAMLTERQKNPEGKPAGQMRLGHVDLVRVATESETGKAGQAQLTVLKKKLQSQIEAKQNQLEKQKTAIEATLKTLTAQQREAKGKAFQKKVEEFQKFGMNAEKELKERQEEFSSRLFQAMEQACSEFGKANGLALVVVKRELLYLDSGVDAQDVTDGVIKLIDKNNPK